MSITTTPSSPEHPLSPEGALIGLAETSGLGNFSLDPTTNSSETDVDSMNQAELLALHAKIEAKLVGITLSDLNLERETLLQFQRAKALQEDANKKESGVPMNQRAQVQNSLGNLLSTLAKMQRELHDSESIKRLKGALIRVVKLQPKEFQDAFFDQLEREFEIEQSAMEAVDEPAEEPAA